MMGGMVLLKAMGDSLESSGTQTSKLEWLGSGIEVIAVRSTHWTA